MRNLIKKILRESEWGWVDDIDLPNDIFRKDVLDSVNHSGEFSTFNIESDSYDDISGGDNVNVVGVNHQLLENMLNRCFGKNPVISGGGFTRGTTLEYFEGLIKKGTPIKVYDKRTNFPLGKVVCKCSPNEDCDRKMTVLKLRNSPFWITEEMVQLVKTGQKTDYD